MKFKIDIHDEVIEAFKRCVFSEQTCDVSPIEILSFPNTDMDDRYAPIWFKGIGIVTITDGRYFLTALGQIIYDQLIHKQNL